MVEWYIVDNFGNQVAGPFYDRQQAQQYASNLGSQYTIISK